MEKIITCENIKNFAYINDEICRENILGIVISFFGLGTMVMFETDTTEGEFYAEKGILYVVPYNNPWAWMNKQAVNFTDEIIDVLIEKYNLSENIPIVATGGSMGGQSALVYTVYAKRQPVACVTNCPVCDVVYHYSERKDLPRTLYSSLFNESTTLKEALKSISPLHLADKMPDIDYHFFHCDKDMAVNIDAHSGKMVAEMKNRNRNFTFDIVSGRGHGDLSLEMKRKFADYTVEAIKKYNL